MAAETQGSISLAFNAIRDAIEPLLQEWKWTLQRTDNAFSAWNALAAPNSSGCVVMFAGSDRVVAQSQRALVVDVTVSMFVMARRHLLDNGTARQSERPGDLSLMEVNNKIKFAMLGLTLPADAIPNPHDAVPRYVGFTQLSLPDGSPLDGIEQQWQLRLLERVG